MSWAATQTADASRQKRGIGKLEGAFQHLQARNLNQEVVSALESLATGVGNLRDAATQQKALNTFYTNAATATPQERGALLIPLFANRARLAASALPNFDHFVDTHFNEAIDELPSANKRPDLQHAIITKAELQLNTGEPKPELAQKLATLCGTIDDSGVRVRIGLNLMVAAQDERLDATLREQLNATVRDTLPDLAAHLPEFSDKPIVQQMIATLVQDRLADPNLPKADKRKLLQSVALALPKLEGNEEIHTALLDAFRPHVNETIAALPAMKADAALQDAMLSMLNKIHAQHRTGKVPLTVQQRKETAEALASTYTAHLERSPGFAEMRMRFVDDEVREEAAANPRETVPFSMEHHVMDLTHIPPDEDDGAKGSSSTRKGRIIDIEEVPRYAKEIGYGERSAASEAAATKLLAATGLPAPKIALARYDHRPQAIVSQLIPGFQDLGKFVLDEDVVKPLIEKEWGTAALKKLDAALQKADKATKELEKLEEQYPTLDKNQVDAGTVPKQNARRDRYQARKSIYQMLPAHIQQTMAKQQFMSQWIGDIDFLNNEWFNAGPKGALDEGNCLLSGFKGQQRGDDNLKYAIVPARADDPYKEVNDVLPGEHDFNEKVGPSKTNVGRIPRSHPVADAVPDSIRAETRMAEYGGTPENMASTLVQEEHALTGQLEAAFQLSLFTNEAIEHLVVENWPEPDNKDVPYKPEDKLRPTAQDMIDYLKGRRDRLVAKFTPEERARWMERNPSKAKAAYHQAAAAIADYTGIYIKPYEAPKRRPEERLRAQVQDLEYGADLPTQVRRSSTVSI